MFHISIYDVARLTDDSFVISSVSCNVLQPGDVCYWRKYSWSWLVLKRNQLYEHFLKFGTVMIIYACMAFFLIGDAVVNVYINHDKKFAFVEMRSVEEASNAMALDGIIFEVQNS